LSLEFEMSDNFKGWALIWKNEPLFGVR
jgi:hypothetical protein